MSLRERLERIFALDPSANAVGQKGRWFSWRDMAQLMETLDAQLNEVGIGQDAAVAVLLRNRPAHLATTLALLRTGRCLVTVNPSLPDQPLVADLASLEVAAVVADEEDWGRPGLKVAVAGMGALGLRIAAGENGLEAGPVAGLELRRAMPAARPGVAVEMLTSGTTGKPKRIDLGYDNLSRSLAAGSEYEAGTQGELKLKRAVGIQWMPLAHIGGLFGALYSIYNGRSFVLMERFDVDEWHRLILEHRPKFVNLPPSALYMVLDRNYPKEDFSSLLALRSGAAPLNHEQALEFERRYDVPVLEGYGATEFAGGVAGWTIRDHRRFAATKRRSVGRANAGVELRIVDRETFEPLPANGIGLLEVRSKQIDGGKAWLRTSDLAKLDEDGFLYILGRADSAIIRGGFKIMPDKVEEALLRQPGVREACVVGIGDERLGQVPVAAITLEPGADADPAVLKADLKERLKAYEVPVQIKVVDALPRTPSLKVSQEAVRRMFAAA